MTTTRHDVGAAFFYHLTEHPLEATLPVLLGKALAAEWKVEVRGKNLEQLEFLDRQLWQGDGFLPHGLSGGPHDAEQPVLLTTSSVTAGAACIMSVGGADVTLGEVSMCNRVCILFDGADINAVDHARGQWKTLADAGAEAQYWTEESGRWIKKAESKR